MSIKDRLKEYLEKTGFEIASNDMVRCPFHDDTRPSMKLYDDHAYCFVCHERADIYNFAAWKLGLPCDKENFPQIAREVESVLGIPSDWRPSAEERRSYLRQNRDISGRQMGPLSKSAVFRDILLNEMAMAIDYGNMERAYNMAELLFALFLLPETVDVSAKA